MKALALFFTHRYARASAYIGVYVLYVRELEEWQIFQFFNFFQCCCDERTEGKKQSGLVVQTRKKELLSWDWIHIYGLRAGFMESFTFLRFMFCGDELEEIIKYNV